MPDIPVPQPKRLLVSIHDVAPPFEREIDHLAGQLADILGGPRFAMLVVPNHWNRAPLIDDKAFGRRLRDWADQGIEMFLHGWFHRDDTDHAGMLASLKARHMTAGEGEFLGLASDQAERRMRAGRDVVEQATGKAVAGFIAPAWLYGHGAHAAMRRCGFTLSEDHWRVWNPASGDVLSRSPVITWASRTPLRTMSSLAVARVARTASAPIQTMRVAVHPGDVTKPELVRSIGKTVRKLMQNRRVSRYADLQQMDQAA